MFGSIQTLIIFCESVYFSLLGNDDNTSANKCRQLTTQKLSHPSAIFSVFTEKMLDQ